MTEALTVIAVDDTPLNLVVLEEMAQEVGIGIVSFADPLEALEYIKKERVDIMFADYMMPQMDGISLIKQGLTFQPDMLTVMVTAVSDDKELRLEALRCGAADFLAKPVDLVEFQARLLNLTKIKTLQRSLTDFNDALKQEVEAATRDLVEREHEALRVLSKTAEYRDPETANHIARVAHYSRLLAKGYGLSGEEQELLFYASPLHDVGKVGIPDAILLKPGKLTDEEFEAMKGHAMMGFEVLKESKNPFLQAGAVIARTHHEKFDGSGYPDGLGGHAIHIYGRITAIADVFDALTSFRPYKKAWEFNEAMDFLERESGRHFDPELVGIFLEARDEVNEIFMQFHDSSDTEE